MTERFPVTAKKWPQASRWISFVVGCFGMAIASSAATFSVWQNAMRAILNQTETDSDLMANMATIGSVIAFPAGMLHERFGGQANAAIGGVMASVAYLVLSFATGSERQFFAKNLWLVDVLYFFVGFASIFTYMSALMSNVDNFTFAQRGKIIGTLDAALSLGPTFLSILYNLAFTHGQIEPGQEANQDLSGYFLTLAIIYLTTSILLFLFTGRVKVTADNDPSSSSSTLTDQMSKATELSEIMQSEALSIITNDQLARQYTNDNNDEKIKQSKIEPDPPNKFSEFPFAELSIRSAIFRWNFWFLVWQFAIGASLQMTYQQNISTYLRSFDLTQYNLLFTVLNTSLQAVSKFAAGFVSDFIAKSGRMPRAIVFLLPYGLQTVFLLISVFYGDNFVVMILTCIFVGVGYGVTWCQTPTLVGELFGSKHLASLWGWSSLLCGVLGFPFTIGFSKIYEAAIVQPGDIYCYGLGCFTWSFAFLAAASFCTCILTLGLTQNMFSNATDRENIRRLR